MNETQYTSDESGDTVDLGAIHQSDKPYLPLRSYNAVIVEASFGEIGANKTPAISLKWEIVEPKLINFQGNDIAPEGVIVPQTLWLTEKALGRMAAFHRAMKLPTAGFNPKAPNTSLYLGKAGNIVISTKAKPMLIEGTQDPVLNGEGKPIVSHQYDVREVVNRITQLDREVAY